MPDLGHSAFPHTEVDNKTGDVIYHKGMPMWAFFFGQALARTDIEDAEKIADAALVAYQKRLAPPEADKPPGLEWQYYGKVHNVTGEPLHIWRRGRDRRVEAAVTFSKDSKPGEGQQTFNRLEELAAFYRISLYEIEEFVRKLRLR